VSAVKRIVPGRELLHAAGQVRRLAHGCVIHPQVAADRPDDDFTGIQPDADLWLDAVRAAHLLAVAANGGLHVERGVAGAHGVVLVGDGRAEQRHDAVAHHLVDGPFVPVDRVHHPLEHRVEQLARLLRVAVGEQFHRALEVREQDRDLLALTFESTP
jgi:hypothetical protein